MTRAPATAKLNLALVVGPKRDDGKHEVTTVLQRLALSDRVDVRPAARTSVEGFARDTLVRDALSALASETDAEAGWRVRIRKRIPVASGLGGGSSDAATALALANATLPSPLAPERLREVARRIGADVPFFLTDGPQLGEGEGAELTELALPQDYFVLLIHPRAARKSATAGVYEAFDRRPATDGYDARRAALLDALRAVERARDLASLPPNDLASSPLADELRTLGAFRADVTGAGPVVYGLFHHRAAAVAARRRLRLRGRIWVTAPAWYG